MTVCAVCKGNEKPPYKCPKCFILYCSVKCYKTHQTQPCKPPEKPKENVEAEGYKYVTEDTIPIETLKQLKDSEELRNILQNPHVRQMLLDIDNSNKPEQIMENAMKEPIFVEFADACLKVVEDKREDS